MIYPEFLNNKKEYLVDFAKIMFKKFNILLTISENDRLTTLVKNKSMSILFKKNIVANKYFHWIEIKNKDKYGWLYDKRLDTIVFETNDYYFIVNKVSLQEYIKSKVTDKTVYDNSNDSYKLVKINQKIMCRVEYVDLMYLSKTVINKNEDINKI